MNGEQVSPSQAFPDQFQQKIHMDVEELNTDFPFKKKSHVLISPEVLCISRYPSFKTSALENSFC